jgi:predicted DNA-binding protein
MSSVKKSNGQHCLNLFISYELKEKIENLAKKYDRTMADIIRQVLKVGIPILDNMSQAQEQVIQDNVKLIKKWRKMKELKEQEGQVEEYLEKI